MYVEKVRVAIIDDQSIGRDILRSGLERFQNIEVVDEAGDGQGAINIARKKKVDIILMDINMPGTSGTDAAHIIKRECPDIAIIAMVNSIDDHAKKDLARAGMAAYTLKNNDMDMLTSLIHEVAEGGSVFAESKRSLTSAAKTTFRWRRKHEEKEGLTGREREVLILISKGENNKDIAHSLNISEKTVKNHITSIFRKLDVEDRTQAVIYAIKNQMVEI
jgi:DNA-binding NarL/FixJ family response regulator